MQRTLPNIIALVAILAPAAISAQQAKFAPGQNFSPNVHLVGHLALTEEHRVADIEVEQDLSRPYAYVSRNHNPPGFQIIDIKDPAKPKLIYTWFIQDAALHDGSGLKGMYFKLKGR